MNGRLTVSASVIVISGLALGLAAGCASKGMSKMGSGDVVADRQRLMKLNGASWADIQAKAKAGNIAAIAVNAETLALNAEHIPALFPEGSLTEKSKAKPEVWQKWAEFEKAAENMQAEAEKLRDAAKAKNAQLTQDIVKGFGKNACGTCHTPFRVPPKRS
ncbi:MAG: c-type cytochrome [Candidatus Rokuibacteriota bacterium]